MVNKNNAKEIREMAKSIRETAEMAEKLADCIEDPKSTEEQAEAVLKELTWAVMKLQLGGVMIE